MQENNNSRCAPNGNPNGNPCWWATGIAIANQNGGQSADNNTVRGNISHDNWGEGIDSFEASGTLLEGNISYNNYSVNFYLSDTQNVTARNNLIYQVNGTHNRPGSPTSGITMADENSSKPRSNNVQVTNNIVYGAPVCEFCWTLVGGATNINVNHTTIVNGSISTGNGASQSANCNISASQVPGLGTVTAGNLTAQQFSNAQCPSGTGADVSQFPGGGGGGGVDTTAPSTPTGLTATAVSSSQINLSWNASTDNVGVTGYRIYRNGTQIGTTAGTSYSNTGLSPSTAYTYTVSAYDAAGNASAQSSSAPATTQAATGDTTPPSVPTGLTATAVSSSQINLSWNASTDNVGVTGYRIYRNGTQIGAATTNSYSDTGLSANTTYSYTVSAYDAAGNTSSQSSSASATTQSSGGGTFTMGLTSIAPSDNSGDGNYLIAYKTTLPQSGTVQSLSFYVTSASGQLRLGIYDATGSGGGPGALVAQTAAFTPTTGWNTQPVTSQVTLPAGTYWLAYNPSSNSLGFKTDFNGNGSNTYLSSYSFGTLPNSYPSGQYTSANTWSFYATLSPASAPPAPTATISANPASITSGQSSTLTWSSTDATSCTGTGFTPSGTSGSQAVSPTSNTTYYITCTGGGGTSPAASATVTVTPAADTTPPSVPTGLTATAVSSSQINLSWNASTDNVGVTGYRIYRNGTQIGAATTNSYSDTGLSANTTYSYTVSAYDAAGNTSSQSSSASATTLPTTASFQVGDRMVTTANLNVRATPSTGGSLLGTQPQGSLGTLIGGPTIADGYIWWNVDYDTGPDGWSVQEYIAKTTPIPTAALSANPASITSGQSSTLTWSSTDATSCTGTGFTPSGTSGSQAVSPTSNTTYYITCTGGGGTSPAASATVTVTPAADTTPPSVPTGLTATAVSSSQINLSWNASTDNVGVTGYRIYRNGTQIGAATTNSYSDTGLSANTTYSYTVSAYDAAGNTSSQSSSASATTQSSGGGTFTMGLTSIAPSDNSGDGNYLIAYKTTLPQSGTVQSLSFYVTSASGQLRLGIYDATGSGGGPGALVAQTAAFTPTTGWNTQPVTSQVTLPAGTYWLAYNPSSNSLGFKTDFNGNGSNTYLSSYSFGTLPNSYPSGQYTSANTWSFYA